MLDILKSLLDTTFVKITFLAAADAVNPCALAVLTLILIAILTANPENRKRVLLAGLSFTTSVYVIYLIYGLILIQFFKTFIHATDSIKPYLYYGLGGLSIILGILNIKDSIRYKMGSIATEMPLFLRPKLKRLISKVTSPTGAFITGIFVTLFLLPCTIGPYIVTSGILSYLDILKALPWLLYYNIIFVLPMIAITLIIYMGYTRVENVSGWKDKHIRLLHLVAGILLALIGLLMVWNYIKSIFGIV